VRKLLIIILLLLQLITRSQDFDAELLLQETSIVFDNKTLTKDLYFKIRINNRGGEKYTRITIPYSSSEKISDVEACIFDANGIVVNKIKKSEITERSAIGESSFYEDNFVKEFTLKHNSYPYTIVYSYQVQQNEFLYIDNWIPVIDAKVATRSASLKVSVPMNYSIAYLDQHVNDPTIDTLEEMITWQWQASYTDLIRSETLSPSISGLLPSVSVTPREFNYETSGSSKDWISYGNWQYQLLQGLNELPWIEKDKIQSLITDCDDDAEKIRILYHYLQDETRYINITIETGGLKPYPANYVADNKYGDCKALTNYFKAVLEFAGITSYYTKVNAGNPIEEINKGFPAQQFNHIILYIPVKEGDIWLDCTSDGAFNYLGTFTQDRDAFIIDSDNSHFIKTPALQPFDVPETRKIEIGYRQLDATAKFQNTYKGEMYEKLLALERNFNEDEKEKIIRNYIVENGFELVNYQIFIPGRDSVWVGATYEATSQNIYKHYGNDILLNNISFSIPPFEKPKDRKLPVQIDYPIYKSDTLIYDIPAGYELNKKPVNFSVTGRYGEYRFNVVESEGKIIVSKSIFINSGYYPRTEYEDFFSFYEQIFEMENKPHLSLNKKI
jgi:hypothetical protein